MHHQRPSDEPSSGDDVLGFHGHGGHRRRFLGRFALFLTGFLYPCRGGSAEPPSQLPLSGRAPPGPLPITPEQAHASFQWLATLAASRIPPVFKGDKGWGETKRIWAGVKLKRDGLQLKTNRRYRELRHGRWARYQLALPEAAPRDADDAGGLQVSVDAVEPLEQGRWRVQTAIRAPMQVETRLERWNFGVQWYSIHIEGEVRVRLQATATVGFLVDYAEIPPALIVDPKIEQARMTLEHLEVHRISKLGRDLAGNLDDFVQTLIEEAWLKKENARLAKRINAKIDRRRDDLRWSLREFFQRNSEPLMVESSGR